jgi:hypothetical protein
MTPRSRAALTSIGAVAALLVAGGIGFVVGRSDAEETASDPTPSARPTPSPSEGVSPLPDLPLTAEGAILQPVEAEVSPEPPDAPCSAVATGGVPSDCGEVLVEGRRVIWIVEGLPLGEGATAHTVRVLSYAEDAAGWVTDLAATDPQARRWTDVRVVLSDVTGDGVPELIVGYRLPNAAEGLDVDVVGYSSDGIAEVIAHPPRSPQGSLVPADVGFDLYAGRYPVGEEPCCPSVFDLLQVRSDEGILRVVATAEVAPAQVPASLL